MQPRIEAWYRREQANEPTVLSTVEDVDALIDTLLMSPVDENLVALYSLERPLLPSGTPDHELMVGVDGNRRVGVLAFMDSCGNVVTVGSPENFRYEEVVAYCEMGHRREFPDGTEIPVELVRRAVKEFLISGGQRPEAVQWQTPEYWLFSLRPSWPDSGRIAMLSSGNQCALMTVVHAGQRHHPWWQMCPELSTDQKVGF